MQYKYFTCNLPSNGLIYPTKEVHLRAKTIFDMKSLLVNPAFQLRSEIDALNNCIDPNDNIDVYDLVNQDVVYLLYKLRSLSDDILTINYNNKQYSIAISELDVKYLDSWNPNLVLPDSKYEVVLDYTPISNVLNFDKLKSEFERKYPDYRGDSGHVITVLNSIKMFNHLTDKDFIRNALENLSFKDSLYLLDNISNFNKQDFGVVEEFEINDENGNIKKIPIQITESFFRPEL